MQSVATVLAAHSYVGPDGLLYVAGGGWEFYGVDALPGVVEGYVAGLIKMAREELDVVHSVTFEQRDPSGQVLASLGSMTFVAHRTLAPFALRFAANVVAPGPFTVTLSDDGGPFGSADSEIRVAGPDVT